MAKSYDTAGAEVARKHGCMDYGPLESEGTFRTRIMGSFSNDFGYREGMRRELMEEVAVQEVKESAVAVINDDSTEVGYVHFGVVHIMHVATETVVGCRSGILGPEFVPIFEAAKSLSGYESWSRLCLEHIELLLSKAGGLHVAPVRMIN